MNQMKLVTILSIIGHYFSDSLRAIDFYTSVLATSRLRLGPEPSLFVDMELVVEKLKVGLIEDARVILEAAKERLDTLKSSESLVFSKYYNAVAEYRKVVGPPQEYYRAALLYLAYTSADEMPVEEKYRIATDLTLAALTSDDIYNFGDVLAAPILSTLQDTPNQWLHSLVTALNSGDIDGFSAILDSNRERYFGQPSLSSRHELIKQKVVLLALVNLAFERPSSERAIPFADIAHRTRLPVDQVREGFASTVDSISEEL